MASTNDVYLLRVAAVDTADRFEFVQAYMSSETGASDPEGTAKKLGTIWDSTMMSLLLACWPTSTFYTSLQARRVNATGGPSFYGPKGLTAQGTALADNNVDASISALLTAPYNKADVGGPTKYGVGRLFIGSVPWNFIADNVWSSAAISAYTAFASAMSGVLTSSPVTFTPCVWSRKHSQYAQPVTWTWVPTIACVRKRAFPRR